MSHDPNDFYRDQCNTCERCRSAMDGLEEVRIGDELYCEDCAPKVRAEMMEEAA